MTQKQEGTNPLKLSRSVVIDTLSTRITKDIADSLEYIDVHEVIGILELLKATLTTQLVNTMAKRISDAAQGEAIEQ